MRQLINIILLVCSVFSLQAEASNQTSTQEFIQAARLALKDQLQKDAYSDIEIKEHPTSINSKHALSEFKIHIHPKYPVAKRVCVTFVHPEQVRSLWFSVKAYQKIYTAKHKILNHSLLNPTDFESTTKDIAGLNSKPILLLPAQSMLSHSINTGQILTQDHLTKIPAVLKGQEVNVQVKEARISVWSKAKALNDGHIGEHIKLYNTQTHKQFQATVRGTNQAEVTS